MRSDNTPRSNEQAPTQTQPQVIYRAVGWVAGTYKPSEAKFYQGVLVTEDGLTIPSELTRQLRSRLKKEHAGYASDPDFFKESFRWTVYPKTDPVEFHLVLMRSLNSVPDDAPRLNEFRAVGEIKSCSDDVVTVRIQRNQEPPQRWKYHNEWKATVLTLEGSVVPPEALGQIWEMDVQRSGERLVVKAGRPYEPSAEDLAWLEKEQSKKERAILLSNLAVTTKNAPAKTLSKQPAPSHPDYSPAPTDIPKQGAGCLDRPVVAPSTDPGNEPQPKPQRKTEPQQVGASPSSNSTDASTESPADAPTLSAANANTRLIPGKMEVVVKLNQFPDDVRTVDKGWLEFVVDTGEALVTITVKPKVFATLKQAKLDYSNWVAAISGQMGEVTLTGFRLESPSIKVFERKAKSPPEQTTLKDSKEPATDLQPSPPGGTQSQQVTAQPSVEPQKTPPAVVNSMQRPKEHLQQQRPAKVPLKRGQNQQRDNGQSVGKQPTTTATQNPHPSQPRFTVTFVGRVFSGHNSVTLNRRMVCIDGKFVGQAKMIVVLGEPLSIQADGEVRQGLNQAVLTSR